MIPPSPPLCFFTLPHAPPSTLFPYTTLFRSALLALLGLEADLVERGQEFRLVVDGHHEHHRRAEIPGQDRKSTRLNSSHGYISYAVFCLKKKKHPENDLFTEQHAGVALPAAD